MRRLLVTLLLLTAIPAAVAEDGAALLEEQAKADLRLAHNLYERGDWDEARRLFARLLDEPPRRLRSADDLHDGLLYYAFTLWLLQEPVPAAERVQLALRLKPAFQPSPVTTRPDLLAFYQQAQADWVAAHGDRAEDVALVFPDVLGKAYTGRFFFPPLTVGLRQLGHRNEADALLAVGAIGTTLNLSAVLTKAALQGTADQQWVEDGLKPALGWSTLFTFPPAVIAVAVDNIAALVLLDRYTKHPELRPSGRGRPKPRVAVTPLGVGVAF